jgi:putative ATPase
MGRATGFPFRSFSAVTSGVKELRQVISGAESEWLTSKRPTILFVDEIHRFNKAQQDAFLPHVESGLIILIGATTQNPSFELISPLLSRARVMVLKPLGPNDLKVLLFRAVSDKARGLGDLDVQISPEAMDYLCDLAQGDARVGLNNLEAAVFAVMETAPEGPIRLDLMTMAKALNRKALPYDKTASSITTPSPPFIRVFGGAMPRPRSTGSIGCSWQVRTRSSSAGA